MDEPLPGLTHRGKGEVQPATSPFPDQHPRRVVDWCDLGPPGGALESVPIPRGGVFKPVCPLGVFAALGKRQNERGPFRGPASWPNPYLVRRYNELLSYGHNILVECSDNVMRMCGFGGCCRTCSPPSWIDRRRMLEGLSAQNVDRSIYFDNRAGGWERLAA